MKAGVLLLWGGCLLSIAGAAVRFVWLSTPGERLLALVLAAAVVCFQRPCQTGVSCPEGGAAEHLPPHG